MPSVKLSLGKFSWLRLNVGCSRRFLLYKERLLLARAFLSGSAIPVATDPALAGFPHGAALTDNRLKDAFTDPRLLEALAHILCQTVASGVARDLRKLRELVPHASQPPTSRLVMHLRDSSDLICWSLLCDPARPLQSESPYKNNRPKDYKSKVIAQKAYCRYFESFIAPSQLADPANPQSIRSGVAWFMSRNPTIAHALTQLTRNFCLNLGRLSARLLADWNDISEVFSPKDALIRLLEIKSTGSDFHKGGQQVLILTFLTKAGRRLRIVYKPSDIEFDFWFIGNSDALREAKVTLPGLTAKNVQPASQTICELVGSHIADFGLPFTPGLVLPTYRILPRNPGSLLTPHSATGALPLRQSYGYIEFLSTDPDLKAWGKTGISDAVAKTDKEQTLFYQAFGALAALAGIFGVSDMHKENVLVHRGLPHLIDLENSFFCPMDGFGGTMMANASIGSLICSDGTVPLGRVEREGTDHLGWTHELQPGRREAMGNRFHRSQPIGPPLQCQFWNQTNVTSFWHGYVAAVHTVAADVTKPASVLLGWLNSPHTQNMILRVVPVKTSELANQGRNALAPVYAADPAPFPLLPASFARAPYTNYRNDAETAFSGGHLTGGYPSPKPTFAIYDALHAFGDFSECDVPTFYQRVSQMELLNSRGEVVVGIPGAVNWPTNAANPPRTTYFSQAATTFVQLQLVALQTSVGVDARLTGGAADLFEKSAGADNILRHFIANLV